VNKERFTNCYLLLLYFLMFLYGISTQAIGTLITRIIEYYGIRMAQAGLLSSFTYIGNFAAIFVLTIFAGRINKIILLGASIVLYIVSLCLISTAPPFSIILACFSLIGVFGAIIDTLANSLVADLMPVNVSRNMSLLHGFFGLGGLCGPVVMERFAGTLNWTQVYFSVSMAYFIYIFIYALFVRWQWSSLATRMPPENQTRFGLSDIVRFFGRKRHVLLWVTMFFYAGNQSILAVWIKRYVETRLSIPVWGAYALSAMWLGTTICRLFISPNINSSSPKKIYIGNFISAIAIIAGLISGSVPGIVMASLVVGLSSGASVPLIIATGCEWNPDKTAYGTIMPFSACYFSYVVFPPLSGLVSDFLGIPWGVALGGISAGLAALFSGILDASLKSESA